MEERQKRKKKKKTTKKLCDKTSRKIKHFLAGMHKCQSYSAFKLTKTHSNLPNTVKSMKKIE